jgi:hypothetical protein
MTAMVERLGQSLVRRMIEQCTLVAQAPDRSHESDSEIAVIRRW